MSALTTKFHHPVGRLAAGAAVLLAGCGHHAAAPSSAAPHVSVVTLRSQAVPITTELPGRVNAYRTADVRPQVNGIILKLMSIDEAVWRLVDRPLGGEDGEERLDT